MPPFWQQLTAAVKQAIRPLRPANIAGPLISTQDRFGQLNERTAAETAQEKRVAAYEEWQRQGARRGIWTNWVGFIQISSGQWMPVHSSNVSAFQWKPFDQSYSGAPLTSTEQALAERRLALPGPAPNPHLAALSQIGDVGPGHGTPFVNIRGQLVDVRDTSRIRTLLTAEEFRQYQDRMLGPIPTRQPHVPVQTGGLRAIAPTARGKRITASTNGILFVRYHDGRIYAYPSMTLGEVLDLYQAPSKGRWVWNELRWSGRPYQQISGAPVLYRMGQGR